MDLARTILGVFPECYLVGGALRDALLKRPFRDIDLAVPPSADFEGRLRRLASRLGASAFPLDEANRVWRLTGRAEPFLQLDLMPFVGGTLESDLARRDFTVNALALKLAPALKFAPKKGGGGFTLAAPRAGVIDHCGGLKDLAAGLVRPVSPGVFKDDPARLLRAFRAAAELEFRLTPAALKAVKAQAALIKTTSPERVRDELLRILDLPDSARRIAELRAAGLLFEIFPDLAAQEGCATAYYGKGGVFTHTLRVLERLDHLLEDLDRYLPGHEKVSALLPPPRLFRLAALLHDAAKPPKAAVVGDRLRFFGHEECGAEMAEKIMGDLRFSRDEIRLVSRMIGAHLRPGNLAANDTVSDRAMFRFFSAMGDATVPLLALCWADHASYVTPEQLRRMRPRLHAAPKPLPAGLPYNSPKKTLRYMQVLYVLYKAYLERGPRSGAPRLVDGNDVMKILKLPAGPRVGEFLERVKLLQFEGRLKTREQALKALKGMK